MWDGTDRLEKEVEAVADQAMMFLSQTLWQVCCLSGLHWQAVHCKLVLLRAALALNTYFVPGLDMGGSSAVVTADFVACGLAGPLWHGGVYPYDM
jgi:hypothetical protein